MTTDRVRTHRGRSRTRRIREQYRRLLTRPHLTDQEIETMRKHMIPLAQTICEHVWGKKFH